jgi:threonylcarbamoyladenosine tRNA methylthiotransferase MtaB
LCTEAAWSNRIGRLFLKVTFIVPRVSFHTLGCKLNYAESSSVERQFLERGFDVVEFGVPADVVVINTCTVTDRADRECRQVIRRARRSSPDAAIIVTGCYAQLEPGRIAAIEGVSLVLGSQEKFHLLDHLAALEDHACARVLVAPIGEVRKFGAAFSPGGSGRTRAFLKVQDGCDYVCSFCTIPLARGGSRSQPLSLCVEQARAVVRRGYREIVLTGVNVGDFGGPDGSFADLLRKLETIPGLDRLRIGSIEPNLLTEEILEVVADSTVLCKHFHIPLQSGSDAVLRRMRRRYTTDLYRGLVERIQRRIPDCGIGADVIVGFPGETEQEFQETYAFLHSIPVTYLHVFTYSERHHTAAIGMPSSVPVHIRRERNVRLRILGQEKRRAHEQTFLGRRFPVLLEGTVEGGVRFGLTGEYVRVGVPAEGTKENTVVHVDLCRLEPGYCAGTAVGQEAAA